MRKTALLLAALICSVALAQTEVFNEGVLQGRAAKSDCIGTGISCGVASGKWNINVTGLPTPPVCADGGAALGWDGGAFTCHAMAGGSSLPTPPVCNDGGCALGWDGGAFIAQPVTPPKSYLCGTLSASYSTNLGQNDHIKFNLVQASSGSAISLDTSTTYAPGNNVASIGRFTVAAGTYRLTFGFGRVSFNNTNTYTYVHWANADTGTPIGSSAQVLSLQFNASNQAGTPTTEVIYTATGSTRLEARITAQSGTTAMGENQVGADGGALNGYPYGCIWEL